MLVTEAHTGAAQGQFPAGICPQKRHFPGLGDAIHFVPLAGWGRAAIVFCNIGLVQFFRAFDCNVTRFNSKNRVN